MKPDWEKDFKAALSPKIKVRWTKKELIRQWKSAIKILETHKSQVSPHVLKTCKTELKRLTRHHIRNV